METDDGNVLLTSALLTLHQTRSTVNADDQATRDFRIKSTAVSSTLAVQNALHPSHDFVGRGIGGLVEINATIARNKKISNAITKYIP